MRREFTFSKLETSALAITANGDFVAAMRENDEGFNDG